MSDPGTKPTPSHDGGVVRHRVLPSAATFLVAAGAVYVTAYLAIGIIQHIVMPILAVLVAGWLATQVWRFTGGERGRRGGQGHEHRTGDGRPPGSAAA